MRRLTQRGVRRYKCATTLELITACEAGATDVLLAYPVMGANARRILNCNTLLLLYSNSNLFSSI